MYLIVQLSVNNVEYFKCPAVRRTATQHSQSHLPLGAIGGH